MTDKLSKKIRFALYLKNNEEVRTKDDFKEFFGMTEIIGYLLDGRLLIWMRDHGYPKEKCEEVERLAKICRTGDELLKIFKADKFKIEDDEKKHTRRVITELGRIFELDENEFDEEELQKIENIRYIKESYDKERVLNKIAAFEDEAEEEEILQYINQIVQTQAELNEVINRLKTQKKYGKAKVVYLLNQVQPYELREDDVFDTQIRFVGIDRQAVEEKTKIVIKQMRDGELQIVPEYQIENFRKKPENRNKFGNLKIITRKRKGITDYENVEIDVPKIKISSEIGGEYDTGIDIAAEKLMLYLDAGLPLIYIDTFEEDKADEIINRVAVERDIYEWNGAEGLFIRNGSGERFINFDNRISLKETLQNFVDDVRSVQYGATGRCQLNNSVLILKDSGKNFDDEEIVALIKYLAQLIYSGQLEDCTIIIVSSTLNIPRPLEHYLTILQIEKLREGEITTLIKDFCDRHGTNQPSEILMKKLVIAFKGMSEYDIINILSLALAGENDLTFSDLDLIIENKKQLIRKTNILEMVECEEKEDDIGGLENLKEWLKKKENTFRHIDEAIRCGVKIPRGILIVGMPGCGKTLTAKATSAIFGLPLLKMDMGKILGKYVGESEKNMHRATKLAELTAPCVLWIDELEKAFAGTGGDGGGEVTARLLGSFLTWMQEKTSPVFVVATANSVDRLPPELLRKGRFDEIFYVGIPNAEERKDIFNIHMDKIRYNENFEWSVSDEEDAEAKMEILVKSTLGCSGADIAGIVSDAVERSFSEFIDKNKYSGGKNQNSGEEKSKPVFNPDIVQKVVDDSGQMSAFNQLKRIFANYKRKNFKNASKTDSRDIFYWISLRAGYIATTPKRVFNFANNVKKFFREVLMNRMVKNVTKLDRKIEHYERKIKEWDEQDNKIKEENLPALPLHFRFCRKVVRVFLPKLKKRIEYRKKKISAANEKEVQNEKI